MAMSAFQNRDNPEVKRGKLESKQGKTDVIGNASFCSDTRGEILYLITKLKRNSYGSQSGRPLEAYAKMNWKQPMKFP